jgi:hypothetical protein
MDGWHGHSLLHRLCLREGVLTQPGELYSSGLGGSLELRAYEPKVVCNLSHSTGAVAGFLGDALQRNRDSLFRRIECESGQGTRDGVGCSSSCD